MIIFFRQDRRLNQDAGQFCHRLLPLLPFLSALRNFVFVLLVHLYSHLWIERQFQNRKSPLGASLFKNSITSGRIMSAVISN